MRRMDDKERAQVVKKLVLYAATLLRRAAILAEHMEDKNGWWCHLCLEEDARRAEEELGWIEHLLSEEQGTERRDAQ